MSDVACRIAKRMEQVLRKAGHRLDDEQGGSSLADEVLAPQDAVLASCYQAAASGRELLGEIAGPRISRSMWWAAPVTSFEERIALVATLTRRQWAFAGRTRPQCTRATMPGTVVRPQR